MQILTIAAFAALLMLPGHEAAGEWIQKGMHGATAKDHKEEKKRWRELAVEMKKLSPKDVQWGQERRPRSSQVVSLSVPYPTADPGKVDVEWFFTFTRGWQKGPSEWLEQFLRAWEESLPGNVYLKVSPVGSMPGTTNRYDEQHTAHQQLAFAGEAMGRESGSSRRCGPGFRTAFDDSASTSPRTSSDSSRDSVWVPS